MEQFEEEHNQDTKKYTQQFINGEFRTGRGEKTVTSIDPYTNEELATIKGASREDIEDAYLSAQLAQREWMKLLPTQRRDVFLSALGILARRKEEIVDLLIRETGSTLQKAQLEWSLVYEGTLEASTYPLRLRGEMIPSVIPGKKSYAVKKPIGVVGVISPWDFSLQLTNRSVAPALAAGNGVVLKPASSTPITGGLLFAEIYQEAGLPRGLLNVVIGDASEIGDVFVENPIPKLITFTGSTEVGRRIGELCGKHLKKVSHELGGNSPFVVLDDADIDAAVEAAAFGKFLNAGQICMAINRIIVDGKVYDEFLAKFVDKVKGLTYGDPMLESSAYGPMINKKQFDRVQELIKSAIDQGAQEVYNGESSGLVMHPVILVGVTNEMEIAQSEIFGPVALILKVSDEEEALRVANETEFGLSSAVFSKNLARGYAFAERIEAGMTHVNDMTINDEASSPFGGEKNSGIGRFGGEWALREMTTDHWITVQESDRRYLF